MDNRSHDVHGHVWVVGGWDLEEEAAGAVGEVGDVLADALIRVVDGPVPPRRSAREERGGGGGTGQPTQGRGRAPRGLKKWGSMYLRKV